eukprot:gene9787-11432_t
MSLKTHDIVGVDGGSKISACYDGQRYIYLIGGQFRSKWSFSKSELTRVDRFDTKTNKFQNNDNSIATFNPETREYDLLVDDLLEGTPDVIYAKCHDGDDLIYFVSNKGALYRYSLNDMTVAIKIHPVLPFTPERCHTLTYLHNAKTPKLLYTTPNLLNTKSLLRDLLGKLLPTRIEELRGNDKIIREAIEHLEVQLRRWEDFIRLVNSTLQRKMDLVKNSLKKELDSLLKKRDDSYKEQEKIYNLITNKFQNNGNLFSSRRSILSFCRQVVVRDNKTVVIYLVGGRQLKNLDNSITIFNPETRDHDLLVDNLLEGTPEMIYAKCYDGNDLIYFVSNKGWLYSYSLKNMTDAMKIHQVTTFAPERCHTLTYLHSAKTPRLLYTTPNTGPYAELIAMIPPTLVRRYDAEVTSLFERNPPDKMKSIESSTRYEIEDKKMQLRTLIGDLVEGSDSIVKMKKSCELINERIGAMQVGLKKFSEKRMRSSTSHTSTRKDGNNKREVVAVAKNAKFLIDITERIWRSIDANDYFEAAAQYLKARYLRGRIGDAALAVLPLLDAQWVAVQQLPETTAASARAFLNGRGLLSSSHYVGALAALVLFEKKTLADTLSEFLTVRTAVIDSTCRKGIASGEVLLTITRMIDALKTTLFDVLLIFYPAPQVGEETVLPPLAITSSTLETNCAWNAPYLVDALAFLSQVSAGMNVRGGSKGWDDTDDDPSVKTADLIAKPLDTTFVHAKTTAWLDETIQLVRSLASDLLAPIKTAKELASLRGNVTNDLVALDKAVPSAASMSWNKVANTAMGRDLTCLVDMFDEIFLSKSERIIESTFSSINLVALMQAKVSSMRQEDTDYAGYIWAYHDDAVTSIKNKTNGITPVANAFLTQVCALYANSIQDFLHLFPDKSVSTSSSMSSPKASGGSASANTPTKTQSVLAKKQQLSQNQSILVKYQLKEHELREFMRKSFCQSIQTFCATNQKTILSNTKSAQEVLFISKLSKLFYKHIVQNPSLFLIPTPSSSPTITTKFQHNQQHQQ